MSDTLNGFFDRLAQASTDPGVAALIGMSQGFGQAAMPSRMPVPFGAALGAGLGGMLEGVKNAQAYRMGTAQLQKAQMENQRAKMLLDWYQSAMNGAGAGGGSAPMGAPSSGGAGGYLTSPQKLASLADLAMATGNDRTAATLYGLPNTMAGGAGYSMGANGVAFPTPGGGADPRTIGLAADAKAWGDAGYKPPADIVEPDGKTDAQGNPTFRHFQVPLRDMNKFGAGGPSTTPAAFSDRIAAWENPGGQPDARNPRSSATGNGQFTDATWLATARKAFPQETQNISDEQLLTLRNDPQVSAAMTQRLAQDNAAVLGQARMPPTATNLALAHRLGAPDAVKVLSAPAGARLSQVLSPEVLQANPGWADQTVGQFVGNATMRFGHAPVGFAANGLPQSAVPGMQELTPQQKADLEVKTAKAKPQILRPGSMVVDVINQTALKNPELKEITLPDGTKQFVHINPSDPFHPDRPGTADQVLMGGAPVGVAVSPDQQAARTELVKQFHGKDADSYVAAQNTQGWLNQIEHAADVMNQAGALSMTGPYADQRLAFMSGANDIFRTLGVKEPFDTKAISSWEEMRKATTTAGFELSSHYEGHARQAAQTIENATSAVPGDHNSPQGIKLVAAGIREGAQSAIDVHQYKQQMYDQKGGAGLEHAETNFYKQFPATMYANRAISTQHPFKVNSPDDFGKYLPGTFITLPNGKISIVPPRDGAPPIPAYISQNVQGAPR